MISQLSIDHVSLREAARQALNYKIETYRSHGKDSRVHKSWYARYLAIDGWASLTLTSLRIAELLSDERPLSLPEAFYLQDVGGKIKMFEYLRDNLKLSLPENFKDHEAYAWHTSLYDSADPDLLTKAAMAVTREYITRDNIYDSAIYHGWRGKLEAMPCGAVTEYDWASPSLPDLYRLDRL